MDVWILIAVSRNLWRRAAPKLDETGETCGADLP
jgi:hypothetical protein